MAKNLFFLSYQHDSFSVIGRLADELRFRGLIPWVDKLPGGFQAGEDSEQNARQAIQDSSAFVLYLTDKALCSDFIRRIEIPEARERQRQDPSYPFVVVSPQYRFSLLKDLTRDHFGVDLTPTHGYAQENDEADDVFLVLVARQLLHRHVAGLPRPADTIALSINTYERIVATPEDGLYVDATQALDGDIGRSNAWCRLLDGMQDAKQEVSAQFGRPRITIHGSKHLTGAFLTGRVFNQFPLNIRQKDDYWTTDGPIVQLEDFAIDYRPGSYTSRSLVVEIVTGHKDIAAGVDALISAQQLNVGGRLQVRPIKGRVNVTSEISRSLAQLVYTRIDEAASAKPTNDIHMFVAAPQSFLMTLGTLFQGQPDVHLYEWTGREYVKSVVVPARLR